MNKETMNPHIEQLPRREDVMKVARMFAASAFVALSVSRAVAVDVVIGQSGISYQDPEIWNAGAKVAWQDENQDVWLADLDPVTGAWIPNSGRGTLLGRAAQIDALEAGTWNGPEWGYSAAGPAVFFTAPDSNGVHQVARYRLLTGTPGLPEFVTAGGTTPRRGVLPGKNLTDPQAPVMTFQGRFRANIGAWRHENEPTTDRPFPSAYFATSGPQWIPGDQALATNLDDTNGTVQVVRYGLDGTTTFLTTDAGHKFDTFFFQAPELGGRDMFVCSVSDIKPTTTVPATSNRLHVYGRTSTGFELVHVLSLTNFMPQTAVNHFSAEPFIFKGRTFFSLAVTLGSPYSSPSEVWVMNLPGTQAVRVSAAGSAARIDPESFVTTDRAFVYYYTVGAGGGRELHVCRDFMGAMSAPASHPVTVTPFSYTAGKFTLLLQSAQPVGAGEIEASTDLVNWQSIGFHWPSLYRESAFVDWNAGAFLQRFYRMKP
jgi:hypothetical protein